MRAFAEVLLAGLLVLAASAVLEGCGGKSGGGAGGTLPPPAPTITSITAVARGGSNQVGTAGSTLAEGLLVKVLDQTNRVVVGASVTFSVTTGSGRFTGKGNSVPSPLPSGNLGTTVTSTTDSNGETELVFFAPGQGANVVTVSATSGSLNHTGLTFSETGF